MNDRLVKVAAYPTPIEADLVRNQLEANGIRAIIADEATAATLWYIGSAIGGCKILVRQEDLEQARAVVQSTEAAAVGADGGPSRDWLCPSCNEENAQNFDFCWRCSTHYPGEQTLIRADDPEVSPVQWPAAIANDPVQGPSWSCPQCRSAVAEEEPFCPACGTTASGIVNPYFARSAEPPVRPATKASADAAVETEQRVARAWRASVIGTFMLPLVLHVYSLYLLLEVSLRNEELSAKAARYFYGALLLNLTMLLVVAFLGRLFGYSFAIY